MSFFQRPLAAVLLAAAFEAQATAVFHINTNADVYPGDATTCSLRVAFANINSTGSQGLLPGVSNPDCPPGQAKNIVRFDKIQGAAIVEASPIPHTANEVKLIGGTVDGKKQINLFVLGSNGTNHAHLLTEDMVLRNGSTGGAGGAIRAESGSSLTLEKTRFYFNRSLGGFGGAVAFLSSGKLTITKSHFARNASGPDRDLGIQTGYGGAIAINTTTQPIDIVESSFVENDARLAGGAIYCATPYDGDQYQAKLTALRFTRNWVDDSALVGLGGALMNGCNAMVRIAYFQQNFVVDGNGGGIYNAPGKTLVVEDAYFDTNRAGDKSHYGQGGALYDDGSALRMKRSSFYANRAWGPAGAVHVGGDDGRTLSIVNTSFHANRASDDLGVWSGAALWIADHAFTPGPPDPIFGVREYRAVLANLSFGANQGDSQIFLEDSASGDDDGTIYFVNNLVDGTLAGGAPCGGDVGRLQLHRDYDPAIYNAQWPTANCDNATGMIPVVQTNLVADQFGGWFNQNYRMPSPHPVGDKYTCAVYAEGEDQHGQSRDCLLGAMEKPIMAELKPPGPF